MVIVIVISRNVQISAYMLCHFYFMIKPRQFGHLQRLSRKRPEDRQQKFNSDADSCIGFRGALDAGDFAAQVRGPRNAFDRLSRNRQSNIYVGHASVIPEP